MYFILTQPLQNYPPPKKKQKQNKTKKTPNKNKDTNNNNNNNNNSNNNNNTYGYKALDIKYRITQRAREQLVARVLLYTAPW